VTSVVLLHAFPLDHRLWQRQADDLIGAGFTVVAPDLPGFGGTGLPDSAPSLYLVADLVLADLESRGIDRCILGGVSLGGYVAMAILRKRPELAAAVVLCGTKATADGDAARENRERLAALVMAGDCVRILEQAVLPGLLGSTTHAMRPEVVSEVRGWLRDSPAETVAWYQRAMAGRADSLSVLASLDVPTLVLWGEEDALSAHAEQDLMLGALVAGELAVIPEAGHLAGVERPDVVSATILRFAESVRGLQSS